MKRGIISIDEFLDAVKGYALIHRNRTSNMSERVYYDSVRRCYGFPGQGLTFLRASKNSWVENSLTLYDIKQIEVLHWNDRGVAFSILLGDGGTVAIHSDNNYFPTPKETGDETEDEEEE